MAEVTALKTVSRRPSRVEVFLEGRSWRVIPATAAIGLRVGMTLDPATQRQIEERSGEAAALERVGRLLVGRPHSEAEVRRRLERAGFPPGTIDSVIDRLRDSGDLDDGAFARAWVENRMAFRPRGAAMLRAELRRRGVAPTAIEAALAELDEPEAAWTAAGHVADRWRSFDPTTRRQRLYAYLQRRGFDHDTIRLVLRRLEAQAEESEETA
jgi:regulatory protein